MGIIRVSMNQERRWVLIAGLAMAVDACAPVVRQLLPSPTEIKPTPTPDWIQHDLQIKKLIENSKVSETLTLKDVLIGSIYSVSTGKGESFVVSLNALGLEEPRFVAFLTSSDCVFDALRAEGKLGPSSSVFLIGRKWHPLSRVDSLTLKRDVYSETPFFNVTGLTHRNTNYNCKVSTISEELKGLLKNLKEK